MRRFWKDLRAKRSGTVEIIIAVNPAEALTASKIGEPLIPTETIGCAETPRMENLSQKRYKSFIKKTCVK